MKRLPAGVRRIRQTRKVCLNQEGKFGGDEKRCKMSFLDKEVASSPTLAVFHVAIFYFSSGLNVWCVKLPCCLDPDPA